MSVLQGRAKKHDGSAIDYVLLFDWVTGNCLGKSTPNSSGVWTYNYYDQINIGITYVADGCEPITHGAYTFTGWSPLNLFDNNRYGVWYDPSDLSTMFQDVAGTIPVTATGQSVALILDKSGNGYHAKQPTVSMRPIYYTDGAVHALRFDGIDDFLDVPYPVPLPPSNRAFFVGVNPVDTGNIGSWFAESYSATSSTSFLSLSAGVFNRYTTTPIRFSSYFNKRRIDASNIAYYGQRSVFASINYENSIIARQNGQVKTSTAAVTYTPSNNVNNGFYIGKSVATDRIFKGDMYGIVFIVKDLSAAEISEAEGYLSQKSVVSMP